MATMTVPTFKPGKGILRPESHPLDVFFRPGNVALIGASEAPGSVGRNILENLITSPFGGTVFPINPKRPSVLGIKAYPDVASVPDAVDLAIIVTPAKTVPGIVQQCVDAGVRGAIIISAGFKEIGPEGAAREREVLEIARRGNLRIVGPNCLGVMSPLQGLNATFASKMALPGNVAFISQSGALLTAVLDYSLKEQIGFSAFVSIGSMLDVGWGDLIEYLGSDPRTESIVIYMESIGDARSFLSAAREVALTKPIIVIKAGRTEVGAKAAVSHTGSLTGSDEVLDAAFRRVGVLRVDSIADMFHMSGVLAKQPRPRGPHLTILTNAGGPGVLATDALIQNGGKLTEIEPSTIEELNEFLPSAWSHGNPIDVLGDASPERYAKALEVAVKDPNSDGVLVILTPQSMSDPLATAQQMKDLAKVEGKPVLSSWMGGNGVAPGAALLTESGVPCFPFPDTAARMFDYMWRYTYNLRGLYETPSTTDDGDSASQEVDAVREILSTVRSSGRNLLTEWESKLVLTAYGIPTVETLLAQTADQAVECAAKIGYPVVLKLHSETVTHKTDVGGVKLNLASEDAVREAYAAIEAGVTRAAGPGHFQGVTVQKMAKLDGYEIILGSSLDPQFGPVLLFGTGGQLVEVFKDRALALPPLNTTLARRMMEQTKIWKALQGVRGRDPIDIAALEQLVVRFSRLVAEQPWIKEIDINPLLASPEHLTALDARIVLHDADTDESKLPQLAIRPYPTRYVRPYTLEDETRVTLRPIRPEDEPLMVRFHETLSEQSVYFRFFHALDLDQRIAHDRLTRMCYIDYDRQIALVADHRDPVSGEHEILGVGRLVKIPGTTEAEIALVVSDAYHGKGLGAELMGQLIQVARDEKLGKIWAEVLPDNVAMEQLCRKLGFEVTRTAETIRAEMTL